jgi:hypothetical protein
MRVYNKGVRIHELNYVSRKQSKSRIDWRKLGIALLVVFVGIPVLFYVLYGLLIFLGVTGVLGPNGGN